MGHMGHYIWEGVMTNLIHRAGSIRRGQLLAVLVVAFSVHAMAQFEVAPDHFDSNTSVEKKRAAKPTTTESRTHVGAVPANVASTKAQSFGQRAVVVQEGQPATSTVVAGTQQSVASTKPTTKKEAARRKKRAAERVALASTN